VRLGRGHLPQRGYRLLGARLLHVAHERVEQHHRQDRDRLVGQGGVALDGPERGGDRGRDEEQNDERILELREELAPRGDGLVGGELVAAVARASVSLSPRPESVASAATTASTGWR
jgi:hypothetical protein